MFLYAYVVKLLNSDGNADGSKTKDKDDFLSY